jgi:hypothetical protein
MKERESDGSHIPSLDIFAHHPLHIHTHVLRHTYIHHTYKFRHTCNGESHIPSLDIFAHHPLHMICIAYVRTYMHT